MDSSTCWIGMLKDHKLRQEMFHKLELTDDWFTPNSYTVIEYADPDRLVDAVVDYFYTDHRFVEFPAKSYAVAIIYAQLLQDYFDLPMMESLADPDLLFGNDKFFVPYNSKSKYIYNEAIEELDRMGAFDPFNEDVQQVKKTIEYFKREFFITPNPYFDNADLS